MFCVIKQKTAYEMRISDWSSYVCASDLITPITVRQHAARLEMYANYVNLDDPQVNLAFGQRNLEMLRDSPATEGKLPKIMAAYNAGLTPVTRWNSEVRDQGDPLLYMESIPYWETREYVAIVQIGRAHV